MIYYMDSELHLKEVTKSFLDAIFYRLTSI